MILLFAGWLVVGCGRGGRDSAAPGPVDLDGDGTPAAADCDDQDAAIGAGILLHPDADGDGFGDALAEVLACEADAEHLVDASDCDDQRAEVHPGAADVCGDGVDGDCDPAGSCRYEGEIVLPGPGARIVGPHEFSELGDEVYGAGDTNGDGYDDVLIRVRLAMRDPERDERHTGAVWLVLGGPEVWTEPLAPAAIFWNADRTVIETWPAGDLDGDGRADVLVGTTSEVHPIFGPFSGEMEVGTEASAVGSKTYWTGHGDLRGDGTESVWLTHAIDGHSRASVYDLSGLGRGEPWTWIDEGQGDSCVSRGASTDMDGDGVSDLSLACSTAYTSAGAPGVVFVFNGPPEAGITTDDADAVWKGTVPGERAGRDLAAPGDVNGDGHGDLLIASYPDYEYEQDGYTYGIHQPVVASLVLGPVSGEHTLDEAEARIECAVPRWCKSARVAGPGDLDADGLDDFVISAPIGLDSDGWSQGKVWLFYDAPSGHVELSEAASADLIDQGYGFAGSSVDVAGDVDGDGHPDLVIGGPYYKPFAPEDPIPYGAAWLIPGISL